jgi:hypothetical protein
LNSATLVCAPRLICRCVSSPNQRSTRLSHEPCIGVKCRWYRGRYGREFYYRRFRARLKNSLFRQRGFARLLENRELRKRSAKVPGQRPMFEP